MLTVGKVASRAGTGSKFSGSGFEIRDRVGLGFHELVSKPVGLRKLSLLLQ